ncbi:MAG: exosortase/archaeosortase family protein [Longimicrobiales bacterium]
MMLATMERPPTVAVPVQEQQRGALVPILITGLAFLVLYWQPIFTLGRDWIHDPEAGHGLLLGPLAVFLGWKRGRVPGAIAQPLLGLAILTAAVLLRYVSGLAAELFTMRMSLLGALAGIIVLFAGIRQLQHWWLSVSLVLLSVPIPAVVLGSLALPLQLLASDMGAALLEWRHIPVMLSGNVIHIPGQSLFVTEACSGLRSLTALLALGVLVGGLWLHYPVSRLLLLAVTIPVAVMLNGLRVFLTGFLVFFVDPKLGTGFMHMTEGWVIFVVAFGILGATAWLMSAAESLWHRRGAGAGA